MTWADFAWDLAAFSESRGLGLFFLGNRQGVARAAADRLRQRHPGLRITGTHHGYFNKEASHPENRAVLGLVKEAAPDILVVGFGTPVQEQWIADNWNALPPAVVMTGGAVFEWVAGIQKRGPGLMVNHGMEWLWRLFLEPRRLFHRYVVGNPLFFWRILMDRLFLRRDRREVA